MPSHLKPTSGPVQVHTTGVGQRRIYLDIQSRPPNVAYPPRPVPGSIADLDIVMEHCDFSEKKVRAKNEAFLRTLLTIFIVCARLP